jgi:hypothetical protein
VTDGSGRRPVHGKALDLLTGEGRDCIRLLEVNLEDMGIDVWGICVMKADSR